MTKDEALLKLVEIQEEIEEMGNADEPPSEFDLQNIARDLSVIIKYL